MKILLIVSMNLCWYFVSWFVLVVVGGVTIKLFKANHTAVAVLLGIIAGPFILYLSDFTIWYFVHGVNVPLDLNYVRDNWISLSIAVGAVYTSIINIYKPYKGIDK